MTAQELRNKINDIRNAMFRGDLAYDDAKKQAQPFIDEMNRRGVEIAKKYGKKHRPFSFASLMR